MNKLKTGFKDPIAIKDGGKVKDPWNFDCPPYDERTSCFINAGTNYGVGHRQPVGHHGNPKMDAPTLPRDRRKVNTEKTDHIYKGRPGLVETDKEE